MTASRRLAASVAVLASLGLGVAAWTWRTGAVGGSDSACYALMTQAFAAGRTQPYSPLALEAPWPEATRVAAPGGFLPSASIPGAAVPVCAPGYALLVAPLFAVAGPVAIFLVPALAAALLPWLAWLTARRLDGPWAGAAAAGLVATTPIVLFQAVQPMNDVVTAALWTAAAVAALDGRAWTTGLLTGLGLLVRPNLAPAAVVVVLVCAASAAADGPAPLRRAWRSVMQASLAAAPGVGLVAALNAALYGSPARSGYGDLGALFALAHVPVNLAQYGRTWVATGTPLVLAAFAAPLLLPRARRGSAWALAAIVAALAVVYLAYRPFPEWWYLRFLLPAVCLAAALAAATVVSAGRRAGGTAGVTLALLLVALTAAWTARGPYMAEARRLRSLEARFADTAAAVAARVPRDAAVITGWQSGPIRFGPGHEVLMWDALDPQWLDRAIAWLSARGTPPAIVLETWEEAGFRARFAGQQYGALDWPPRYDIDRRVHVFRPEDRRRFVTGGAVATETIFPARRR